jgi:hypothetical protein
MQGMIFNTLAMVLTIGAATVHAQTADHLKCYKIKDPLKLTGTVDLMSPQFGLQDDCKISLGGRLKSVDGESASREIRPASPTHAHRCRRRAVLCSPKRSRRSSGDRA